VYSPPSVSGPNAALLGAVLLGALNTLGDFLWAHYALRHRAALGLTHGALLLMALGLYIGLLRRRPLLGAAGGAGVGLAAAAAYYALAPLLRFYAMLVSWMALWIGFALLDGRVLQGQVPPRESLLRGAIGAVGSGLAFYAISGIWTRPNPGGPSYGYNFLCWTMAFLPGFMALLLKKPREAPGPG
jgi:hypothetical protein